MSANASRQFTTISSSALLQQRARASNSCIRVARSMRVLAPFNPVSKPEARTLTMKLKFLRDADESIHKFEWRDSLLDSGQAL